MEKVLLIDDDVELCELVSELLTGEGFRVEACHNGGRGLERAKSGEHTLVILDVMLPGLNGLDVLRRLRSEGGKVPVLMLTARGSDTTDRIIGLEVGADDYLPKPCHPRELVARIRAVLRRTSETTARPAREVLTAGEVWLDTGARTVLCHGEQVTLTGVEFDLLTQLLRHAGQVAAREDLARIVLGREYSSLDRSLDMHVSNLRRKLGSEGEYIKTIRSVGYQFALPQAQAA